MAPSTQTVRDSQPHKGTDAGAAPDAHGRQASSPTQIPVAGWKDIAWRLWEALSEDRVMLVAGGATFYLLLAMVPTLSAMVSIYGLFADRATLTEHVNLVAPYIPGGAVEIIRSQLERLTSGEPTALGVAFLVSLGLALWSSNAGMKGLFEAMNVAYAEGEKRSFIKLNLVSLLFTLGGILGVIVLIGAVVVAPVALAMIPLPEGTSWLIRIGAFGVVMLMMAFGLALLYRYGPSREEAQWRWLTPGSTLATVAVVVLSVAFSWYVANFGSYNETYGSLGAIIGFMTWVWLSLVVVMMGAELNAEMEHQTAQDTTDGAPKPIGSRGAYMADTIGKGQDGRGQSTVSASDREVRAEQGVPHDANGRAARPAAARPAWRPMAEAGAAGLLGALVATAIVIARGR